VAGRAWRGVVAVGGGLEGELHVWIDEAGATGAARRLIGMDEEPDDSVVRDMLREMWAQAATMVAARPAFTGLTLTVAPPERTEMGAGLTGWTLATGGAPLAAIAVTGAVARGALAAQLTPGAPSAASVAGNLAVLLDIDLPLVVRFARTELTLKALTALGPGSMVDMGRAPEDPVQVLVGGQVVAEGDVVVVGGNYGVRITTVLSPAERVKTLEGRPC
jgi:flagellar motor switch protein FliN